MNDDSNLEKFNLGSAYMIDCIVDGNVFDGKWCAKGPFTTRLTFSTEEARDRCYDAMREQSKKAEVF